MKNIRLKECDSNLGFRKSLIALLVMSSAPTYALAEEVPNTTNSIKEDKLEVIQVSGSRLKTRPGYDAPTPTTILDSGFLNEISTVNVADALNRLPSMGSGTSPRSTANDVGSGTQGASFMNLRGLGSNRTLVLLDSKRVVGASPTGEVDINMIPTSLIKRTEIVSGGASAAWGSDAVSGVVNFILDKDYVGLKGSIQGGQSGYEDAGEFDFDLASGFEFDNGRGHVLASVNYTSTDGVKRADSRDWFKGTKIVRNPDWVSGNGEPERLVLDNIGHFLGSDAGNAFLTAGPLAGITFSPDGSIQQFDFGTIYPGGPLSNSTTGDGQLNDLAGITQLLSEYEKVNSFFRISYEINDDIEVYGELTHSATEAESISVPYFRFAGALTVYRDNAFMPQELANQMDALGMTSLPLARTNYDFGQTNPYNDRKMARIVVGADVQIDDNWLLETYYQRGQLDVINEVRTNANRIKYDLATDAVNDGNGNVVCRSTLTDSDNGCVAANIFGFGAPSQAAIDYVIGAAHQDVELIQDVFSSTVSGNLFELPAGAVSSSFGYEYRKEQFSSKADAISNETNWWLGNYKDAAGEYDVNEVFAEVLVPVFYDSDFGESLDLNAAARLTDYSTSGKVTTWKVGLSYNIGAGVSLRGTQSRDIRAPNLNEYFSGGQTNSLFFDDPTMLDANNNPLNYLVPRTIAGNPELDPEEADTITFGLVYAPEFIEGLEFSLDYFNVDINGAIDRVIDQDIVDRCYGGEGSFCDLITRDQTTGLITNVFSSAINLTKESLTAYDFEVTYRFDAAGGTVDLHSLWTHTTEHYTEDRGVRDSLLGEYGIGGPQEWVGLSSARYTNEGLTLSLRHRYIGEGVLDASWTSGIEVDNNKVDSVHYIDFTANQRFDLNGTKLEVFVSVDNLFDKEPPRAGFIGSSVIDDVGASPVHDLIGRYFRIGSRFEF